MFMSKKLSIIKITILSKLMYRFDTIPIKFPADFLQKLTNSLKNLYEMQGT